MIWSSEWWAVWWDDVIRAVETLGSCFFCSTNWFWRLLPSKLLSSFSSPCHVSWLLSHRYVVCGSQRALLTGRFYLSLHATLTHRGRGWRTARFLAAETPVNQVRCESVVHRLGDLCAGPKYSFPRSGLCPPVADSTDCWKLTVEFLSGHCPQPQAAASPKVTLPSPGAATSSDPSMGLYKDPVFSFWLEPVLKGHPSSGNFWQDRQLPLLQLLHSSTSHTQSCFLTAFQGLRLRRSPLTLLQLDLLPLGSGPRELH